MRSFLLNKLVRDKVFVSMQELGQKITHRQLDDKDFAHELKRKLLEEASEFDLKNPEKAAEELADILEVVEALGKEIGKDFGALREIQAARQKERGAFAQRIFIERLDLEDNDPWVTYYAKEPERFREV